MAAPGNPFLSHPRHTVRDMRALNAIQMRLPLDRVTPLEAWLLDLGLKAIEVAACPVPDCVVCAATEKPTPKAA